MFDDAYRSTISCILVDNIERLLDYGPIGPRYSNLTLQALLILLKKEPPPGKKLLVLCTSSRKQVLEEMEMLPAFTGILHVPNINKPEQVMAILESTEVFNKQELASIAKKITGKRWVSHISLIIITFIKSQITSYIFTLKIILKTCWGQKDNSTKVYSNNSLILFVDRLFLKYPVNSQSLLFCKILINSGFHFKESY